MRSLDARELSLVFIQKEEGLSQPDTDNADWTGQRGGRVRSEHETSAPTTITTSDNHQQPLPVAHGRFPDSPPAKSLSEEGGSGAPGAASAASEPIPGADATEEKYGIGGGGGFGDGGGGNVVQEIAAEVVSRAKQRLMALKMLFDDGIISEADFSTQKTAILASI